MMQKERMPDFAFISIEPFVDFTVCWRSGTTYTLRALIITYMVELISTVHSRCIIHP